MEVTVVFHGNSTLSLQKTSLKTSAIFIVMVGETTICRSFPRMILCWNNLWMLHHGAGYHVLGDVCPSSMACQLEIGRLGWMKEASQRVLAIICYIVFVFENIKFLSISTMDLCLVLIFKQIREVFWWTCGLQILRPISWDANRQQSHFSSLYKPFLGSPTALLLKNVQKKGDVWDPLEIGKLKPR